MQNLSTSHSARRRIAILGAGPGGLAAGRWLLEAGLDPVIFEASADIGGQWNLSVPGNGTWPEMRTNTSRAMTCFSDLDYSEGTQVFPRVTQVQSYLRDYAARFGLDGRIRSDHRVTSLRREGDGWLLTAETHAGLYRGQFDQVIIATGRHRDPLMPEIPGLSEFSGRLGVRHAREYCGTEPRRGSRVMVAGCSISALEIASELAQGAASEVILSARRMRYVLPKLVAGVPTDHLMFTRAAARAMEILQPEQCMAAFASRIRALAGNPALSGAMAADDDVLAAGISQSQGFLSAVAEGRIETRPWISLIEGKRVTFTDQTVREVDGIILGTGYGIALPFLDDPVRAVLGLDADGRGTGLRLHAHSFHPDLPGLAFLGLYDLVGPYFPVLELQARWIARCLAGHANRNGTMPAWGTMAADISGPIPEGPIPMQVAALDFARRLGAEPELGDRPRLARLLAFGPLAAVGFRLDGPDRLTDAETRLRRLATAFDETMLSGADEALLAGLQDVPSDAA
ncbi:NAD(P)/FAD-dependent oxidoreductase [Poseidonocella sp. HB161398]|uniref:flavin-containing monooxygenase n=1 Tax=Poseidonocella sp. HB161398 TaxID=2320855 RepID=UPI001109675E|nr:NAD(P)-binding domain-containing protein [Poseidonocella sp. HB161398]